MKGSGEEDGRCRQDLWVAQLWVAQREVDQFIPGRFPLSPTQTAFDTGIMTSGW
jgi:hypothetical protein